MTKAQKAKKGKWVRVPTHFPTVGRATVAEAMEFLRVGKTRLYEIIAADPAISFVDGGRRLFDWRDLWARHEAAKTLPKQSP